MLSLPSLTSSLSSDSISIIIIIFSIVNTVIVVVGKVNHPTHRGFHRYHHQYQHHRGFHLHRCRFRHFGLDYLTVVPVVGQFVVLVVPADHFGFDPVVAGFVRFDFARFEPWDALVRFADRPVARLVVVAPVRYLVADLAEPCCPCWPCCP